jgi:parallel beta-helix repeat protein
MIGDYETNYTDLAYGPTGSYITGITIVGTGASTDPATQFGGGIRIISGKDVQVYNCRFKDLRGIGINAVGVNDIYNEGIKAHHNYIYNCHGDGIYYFLAHHSDITDNQVFDSGFTDSIIFEAVQFGKVMNNHIYHSTNRGILINTGSDNCVVSGNTIIQNKVDNGIFLTSVRRCVVANNYIWSETGNWAGITTDKGMYSWNDSYHIIQGNIIRNGRPGIRISTDYNSISDNMIYSGTEGIIVDGGNYNTLRNNDTHADGFGIKLRGQDGRPNPIGTVVLNNRTDRIDDAGTNSTKLGNVFSNGPISGKAKLVAGSVTVNTAEVLPVDAITLSRSIAGGDVGHLSIGTIVSGTSFVINSSSLTDSSTIFWEIRH